MPDVEHGAPDWAFRSFTDEGFREDYPRTLATLERLGLQEVMAYDPDAPRADVLRVWRRRGERLVLEQTSESGVVESEVLQQKFIVLSDGAVRLVNPETGEPWPTREEENAAFDREVKIPLMESIDNLNRKLEGIRTALKERGVPRQSADRFEDRPPVDVGNEAPDVKEQAPATVESPSKIQSIPSGAQVGKKSEE